LDDHIYKKVEIVGTSTESSDAAVRNAIAKAGETIRHLRWFEVTELRGDVADNQISHWQATVRIGFRIVDADAPNG
jgi:dodecin